MSPGRPDAVIPWIIDRAVDASGAYTIKFTEVFLREYVQHPTPMYLVGARDAAQRVGPS
jgi:hypothetical protein